MALTLAFTRLDPQVPVPTYGYADDAGFDLYTVHPFTLAPGMRVQVHTGIAVRIPEGYVGLVWDKSGLSHKYGIKTMGGVIDSGYRGEILVGLVNVGTEPHTFERYHKVAQMIIQKKETPQFVETDDLGDGVRGDRGFGSSGV